MPRVSPYRLAAHLGSAFAIYAVLLWTTLTLTKPVPSLAGAGTAAVAAAKRLRGAVHPLAGLVALTAISGEICNRAAPPAYDLLCMFRPELWAFGL